MSLPVAAIHEILTNLSPREQRLLPTLDVLSVGWVRELLAQGAVAEMLPLKTTHDPTHSS